MHPILFKFAFFQIYSYGFMLALAFLVSTCLLNKQAPKYNLAQDFFWNLSFWILLGGILGGRIFYILLNLNLFLADLKEIFRLWHGGLIWYGGFFGGLLAGIIYIRLHGESILELLDLIIPFAALGQSIGRIGCLLNGCCYGRPVWWGVYFPVHNDYLIPAQAVDSFELAAIFVFLRFLQEKPHRKGFILTAYFLLSSLARFLLEFLRNDSPRSYSGLTVFQIISLAVFISAICLGIIILLSGPKKRESG